MDDDDNSIDRVVGWVVDHLITEANLEAPLVVAGDPEVLWKEEVPLQAPAGGWAWLPLAKGSGLLVDGGGVGDGPWFSAFGTSDGPLDQVGLVIDIWRDPGDTQVAGELVLPSGRLVVGQPEAVAAWGPAVAPDNGEVAQTKAGWDEPEPTYVGLIGVVQAEPGTRCVVEVCPGAKGGLYSIVFRFPRPSWTPSILQPK